jgi:hypothetical protein
MSAFDPKRTLSVQPLDGCRSILRQIDISKPQALESLDRLRTPGPSGHSVGVTMLNGGVRKFIPKTPIIR